MNRLTCQKEFDIRFSEVDSMGIVWHGSYSLYFEDAREEFGRQYNIEYLYIFEQGFYAPIVELHIEYKNPLRYKDRARIEISYRHTEAAKLIFDYKIFNADSGKISATGYSVQVFLDRDFNLMWDVPAFIRQWREKYL